tara:strand:+ start:828 stop:953 length:126 start_codon:yes stop_codon:yes gene_type:complete
MKQFDVLLFIAALVTAGSMITGIAYSESAEPRYAISEASIR